MAFHDRIFKGRWNLPKQEKQVSCHDASAVLLLPAGPLLDPDPLTPTDPGLWDNRVTPYSWGMPSPGCFDPWATLAMG